MNIDKAFSNAYDSMNKLAEAPDVADVRDEEPMLYKWQVTLILQNLEEEVKS